MKTSNILVAAFSLMAGFGMLTTSCDAIWDASVDDYPYYGDYYEASIDKNFSIGLPSSPDIGDTEDAFHVIGNPVRDGRAQHIKEHGECDGSDCSNGDPETPEGTS